MKRILYIHGFASTGNTSKVKQLQDMGDIEVIAPTLSHKPCDDIGLLENLIREHAITTVVGSSLGGFYALYLAQRFDVGLILINPALYPYDTLKNMIGQVSVYGTNVSFSWTEEKVDQLRTIGKVVERALNDQSNVDWVRSLVLLATHDELLNSEVTASVLNKATVIQDSNEDHRFQNIIPYANDIHSVLSAVSISQLDPNPRILPSKEDVDTFLAKKAVI